MTKYIIIRAGVDCFEDEYDRGEICHKAFWDIPSLTGKTWNNIEELKGIVEAAVPDIDWKDSSLLVDTFYNEEDDNPRFRLEYTDMVYCDVESFEFYRASREQIENWKQGKEELYARYLEIICAKLVCLQEEDYNELKAQGFEIY